MSCVPGFRLRNFRKFQRGLISFPPPLPLLWDIPSFRVSPLFGNVSLLLPLQVDLHFEGEEVYADEDEAADSDIDEPIDY